MSKADIRLIFETIPCFGVSAADLPQVILSTCNSEKGKKKSLNHLIVSAVSFPAPAL